MGIDAKHIQLFEKIDEDSKNIFVEIQERLRKLQ